MVNFSWDVVSHPLGGAITYFGPGERERYQGYLSESATNDQGQDRVFFAGEHLGVVHGWMQSAVSSAISTVLKVLQQNP
jgi:monoamine oxidase